LVAILHLEVNLLDMAVAAATEQLVLVAVAVALA
jgi:hypothetical protein